MAKLQLRCERLENRDTPGVGALDPTFGVGGIVIGPVQSTPYGIAEQADGKILVTADVDQNQQDFALVRYNVDGTVDTSFGAGGILQTDFNHHRDFATEVVVQPDGKILVGGFSYDARGNNFAIARYNAEGTIDTTFGTGGKVETEFDTTVDGVVSRLNADVNRIVLQGDGKIVVAGGASAIPTVTRYTANGRLDPTFGDNGIARLDSHVGEMLDVAVQTDGKIVATGGGLNDPWLIRLNGDGTADPALAPPALPLVPSTLALQPDGQIVVAGHVFLEVNGDSLAVARFRADGTTDTGFGDAGMAVVHHGGAALEYPIGVVVQTDGKIVLSGSAIGSDSHTTVAEFVVLRFDEAGPLDPTFGDGGVVATAVGNASAALMQSDGKIVLAGQDIHLGSEVLARYTNDGAPAVVPPGGSDTPPPSGGGGGGGGVVTPPSSLVAYGAGEGGGPHVIVVDAQTGQQVYSFFAYNATFTGGVRVATADVTGDGVDDIITAAGPTGGPHVKIFDGTTGKLFREFMAYSPGFTGGVYVAAADLNHDGHAEIITGAGEGGGPHVKVFDGATGAEIAGFMAYNPAFAGGVRVAAADLTGDGAADIITGAGPTGGPHVRVFDGPTQAVVSSFYAGPAANLDGVFVSAGDVEGTGQTDVIVSTASAVRAYRAGDVLKPALEIPIVGPVASTAAFDFDGDGRAEIVTGSPSQHLAKVVTLRTVSGLYVTDESPFGGFLGGVFVG